MAIYTRLPLPTATRLAAPFGLSIVKVKGLIAGSVNSNFALTTEYGGLVFARIYEEQDTTGARAEVTLLDWLSGRGLQVVRPLRSGDGEAVVTYEGKPMAFFPWVAGQSRCQATVGEGDTRKVGAALARIHLAGSPEPRPGRFRVADLRTRCEHITAHGDDHGHGLSAWGARLAEAIAAVEARRHPDAHRGLCHGDLFRDNVLWQGDTLAALLDFESAAEERFAFDLAVTVLAWTYGDDFSPPLARALVAGYEEVRPLPPADREALFAEAQLAALRFTVTRVTDYAMRAHLKANTGRDFGRFWARYEALEAMGPAGWSALLGL